MAVAVDTAGSLVSPDFNSQTASFTCSPFATTGVTAAATALSVTLCFMVNHGGTMPTGITVTYNSIAMSLVSGADSGTILGTTFDGRALMYGITAPASGNHPVVISWSNGANTSGYVGAISWTGTDTATPFKNGTSSNGSTSSPSITITSPSGDFAIASLCSIDGATVNSMSGTTLFTNASGDRGNAGANYTTGVGSTSLTATLSAANVWAYAGCDVQAPITGSLSSQAIM